MRPRKLRPPTRRGATTVEMALVLPVFLFFVMGVMGAGHLYMVSNTLKIACRSGARYGSTQGITTEQVQTRVQQILAPVVPAAALTSVVKDASVYDGSDPLPESAADFDGLPDAELSDLDSRQMFLVRATVDYNQIRLVPLPFLTNITLTGQSFTRHE